MHGGGWGPRRLAVGGVVKSATARLLQARLCPPSKAAAAAGSSFEFIQRAPGPKPGETFLLTAFFRSGKTCPPTHIILVQVYRPRDPPQNALPRCPRAGRLPLSAASASTSAWFEHSRRGTLRPATPEKCLDTTRRASYARMYIHMYILPRNGIS